MTQVRTHDGIRSMLVTHHPQELSPGHGASFPPALRASLLNESWSDPYWSQAGHPNVKPHSLRAVHWGVPVLVTVSEPFLSTIQRYVLELDASLKLADRRGRVAECVSALTR
jgi:hypothetical protein